MVVTRKASLRPRGVFEIEYEDKVIESQAGGLCEENDVIGVNLISAT